MYRWSRFKNLSPDEMFKIVGRHVFPFLRNMAEAGTAHATHMKGARFTIPTPALLAKVVDLLADIPMEDRDTKGDLYEYMLSKIASELDKPDGLTVLTAAESSVSISARRIRMRSVARCARLSLPARGGDCEGR